MTANLPAVVGPSKTALAVVAESERDAASRYAISSKAEASRIAYASDWQQFTTWTTARHLEAIPASVETVSRYLGDMAENGFKVPTIRRRAAAIAYFHRLKGLESPTSSELVRAVLSGIAREKAQAANRKAPVTVDIVRRMMRLIPTTTIGTRDRALLLVGFAGALRRSELVALNIEDLERTDRGVLIHIRKSKTDQEGEGRTIAIPRGGKLKTLEALDAWIGTAGLQAGSIFRNVRKGGVISERLTDRSVSLIVKKYAERAQLDPAIFAGHSLRAGFVTSALDAGADPFRVMDVTGHREIRTLRVYDRRSKFEKHAGRSFL
jgi:site-specific recombinase XerD